MSKDRTFFINVAKIMTGTTFAQVLTFAATPFLARLFSAEDFGYFAIFSSVVSMVAVFCTGRLNMAIILPEADHDAFCLFLLGVVATIIVSCVTGIGVYLLSATSLLQDMYTAHPAIVLLIPVGIAFNGLLQLFGYMLNRTKRFGLLSESKVVQAVFTISATIIFGKLMMGAEGLVFGVIIGLFIACLRMGMVMETGRNPECTNASLRHDIMRLLKLYRDYPLKGSLGAFLNAASYQAENLLFAWLFGFEAAGYYFFASRLLSAIKSQLSTSVWQVFVGTLRNESVDYIFAKMEKYQERLVYIIMPFAISIFFLLPHLWQLFFSEKWLQSLPYVYIMIGFLLINLTVSSFSLFLIINKPSAEMWFNLYLFLAKIICIFIVYYFSKSVIITVGVMYAIQASMFLLLGAWNYQQLGRSPLYFFKKCLVWVLRYLPIAGIFMAISSVTQNIYILISAIIVVNITYYLLVRCGDEK